LYFASSLAVGLCESAVLDHMSFHCSLHSKDTIPVQAPLTSHNMLVFHHDPQDEGPPIIAVHNYLLNIFQLVSISGSHFIHCALRFCHAIVTRAEMGHTSCSIHREMKNLYRILYGKCEGKDHLGDVVINGRMILKCKSNIRLADFKSGSVIIVS